jgi:cytochrome b
MSTKILVWDIPTRVFHWLLALSFAGAFITGDSERYRDLHVMFGYTLSGLIGFRLLWGLVGSRYARFRSFPLGPHRVLAYFRSLVSASPAHFTGHNPPGSWAILLLLALGLISALSGYVLFTELAGGDWLEELHEAAANAMLTLVIVHIVGVVLSSLLHRENLIGAMVTGYKPGLPEQSIGRTYWLTGAILLAAVVVFWAGPI